MNKHALLIGMSLAVAVTAASAAEEEKKEKESPWTATLGLGYVNTSGNTNTETLIFKADVAYEIEKWKHEGHLDTLNASTDDVTTADRLRFGAQSNYKFRPRDYFYGLFNYEDDKFSARVSTAYRDPYQTRSPNSSGRDERGYESTTNVDFAMAYRLTDTMDLTLEVLNLTDEYENQLFDIADLVFVHHHTGTEFILGFRWSPE